MGEGFMDNYRDIAAELRRRIRKGVYKNDTALPSRMELLKEFNVARSTLDRAVALLSASGDVVSRRGSGTYVNSIADYRVGFIGRTPEQNLRGCEIALTHIPEEWVEQRSENSQLLDFDALIWLQPDRNHLEIARRLQGKRPQLILNRMEDDLPGLSFDHRGAYKDIILRRLDECPEGVPVFLRQRRDTLPARYRLNGFADGCREKERFYEIWHMPDEFEEKVTELRRRLKELKSDKPLLIVSDSLFHTGAVMVVAREQKWQWKKTHFYSDFDNDYTEAVWGVNVTSFFQDTSALIQEGAKRMKRMLDGKDDGKLTLIPALFRNGDT